MGKSLQPQKATAVRQPANTPAAASSAVAATTANEPLTAESLGWQLRAALPPMRLHSVSLCDEQANVLWLSEGALGPDEHNVVLEGIDALTNDSSLPYYEAGMEDSRIAIFLPVRSPTGGLVGLAMILADIKSVGDGVVDHMISPQVRTIMQRVAVLLRPAAPKIAPAETPNVLALAETPAAPAPAKATPAPAAAPAARKAPAAPPVADRPSPPTLTPQAVDDILEFELTPDLPSAAHPHTQTQRLAPSLAVKGPSPGIDLGLDFPTAPPAASKPVVPTLTAAPVSASAGSLPTTAVPTIAAAAPVVNGSAARTNGSGAVDHASPLAAVLADVSEIGRA